MFTYRESQSKSWVQGLLLLLIVWFASPGAANAATGATGEDDFGMACAACHTIGGGRLIGPDLIGIAERRSPQWLVDFVVSSQTLIKNGDTDAVALFNEYNGMIMPDAPLSESQVTGVLAYIAGQEAAATEATTAIAPVAETVSEVLPTEAEIALGQDLFQGRVRFEAGGPTCNACHDVKNDAVIGGGVLARELTNVFSTMGREGVKAVIGQAPFPVMQAAYAQSPLTAVETSALVAFLQDADAQHAYQQPRDYGFGLLTSGVVGSAIVFGLCGFVWRGRRKGSVNQDIYDRQTKSV